jgi:transcriptional regulator with XRE-family HTH domain
VELFKFVGETLRRLRKESGKTLEQISSEARLGRGQLSRIENGHQSATLKTLGKILTSQHLSRREFFRRYELVETELQAAKGPDAAGAPASEGEGESAGYPLKPTTAWPNEVREALSRVESFITTAFNPDRPLAQGAIELGDLLILFRVVPKSAAPTAGGALGVAADTPAPTAPAAAPVTPAASASKPAPARKGRPRRPKKR